MSPIETANGYCHVCGQDETFHSFEPLDFPCKRNSFICQNCGASGRNRHIAKSILERFPLENKVNSLTEFADYFTGNVFVTSSKGAIPDALAKLKGLVCSEYIDGVAAGEFKDSVLCQDIQRTSFQDDSFDLVITEDVLEHVPFPEQAFLEIKRILRPGGHHISTIPVKWDLEKSRPRAIIKDGVLSNLLEPEFHLDPTRAEGILAFTDYGQDIVDRFCSLIGPSELITAHLDLEMEKQFAIYNNWVFISRKSSPNKPSIGGLGSTLAQKMLGFFR
jgi:SAM-dependent methyltransferase